MFKAHDEAFVFQRCPHQNHRQRLNPTQLRLSLINPNPTKVGFNPNLTKVGFNPNLIKVGLVWVGLIMD